MNITVFKAFYFRDFRNKCKLFMNVKMTIEINSIKILEFQ